MGIMGLLFNFAFQCFHVLAWPLLALCYPLFVSIQAIEKCSDSDILRLITYWVCFSIILLLEHVFHELFQWWPYWPSVKLIIVGCLVLPYFDGSFYVYNHVVHPCLSINPRTVFNWFIKTLEIISKEDNFQTETKKEAKETDSQALQNVIDFKVTQTEPEYVLPGGRDFSNVTANKNPKSEWTSSVCLVTATSEADLISHFQGKRHADELDKKKPKEKPSKEPEFVLPVGRDFPDVMAACNKKPQNEWTCAVCQVTATSEADLISHLQGKRHADGLDQRKPKEKTPEGNVSPVNSAQTSSETVDSEISQALWTCVLCKVKCMRKKDLIQHFEGQRHVNALASLKANPNAKYFFKAWTCEICNVQLKNKNDLILHLESKRHSSACQIQKMETKGPIKDDVSSVSSKSNSNLPTKKVPKIEPMNPKKGSTAEVGDCKRWCSICNVSCSGQRNMNQHFKGKKHLAMILEQSCSGVATIG